MAKVKCKEVPGTIILPSKGHPYFKYVDQFGVGRKMFLWVEGTKLHIADIKLKCEYSIEGKLVE